jgi:predicted ATP-grasp superfamily ATP-dependent carboligase
LQTAEVEIEFPAMLKPLRSTDWREEKIREAGDKRKAIFLNSKIDLWSEYSKFGHILPKVLLQEYVEGEDCDIYTFCSYCDKYSNVLLHFNTQKIRQLPERTGTGIIVKSTINDDLTEPSKIMLKQLGFSGISEIEYKRDFRTGKYHLIEINPRFWDQHSLSMDIGLNLPLVVYYNLTEGIFKFSHCELQQTIWIAEDSFALSLVNNLFGNPRQFLRMLTEVPGKKSYAIWSSKDPVPFVVSMIILLIGIVKRGIMKVKSR